MRFLRALFFLLTALCWLPPESRAQSDSASKPAPKPKEDYGHQLRFSFDLSRPAINLAQSTRSSYEGAIDYYLRNELYAVAEGGAGSSEYAYTDLSYISNSSFFRIGLDKTLIKRLNGSDWDAAFAGVRYGIGFINRGEAAYTIIDSVWGTTSGTVPAKAFTAHWAEVTGGVRVEVIKGFMLGWNLRGRFLLNERAFRELSPVYIAGYGKGDKSTIFDFSFYACYAIRWGKGTGTKKAD